MIFALLVAVCFGLGYCCWRILLEARADYDPFDAKLARIRRNRRRHRAKRQVSAFSRAR